MRRKRRSLRNQRNQSSQTNPEQGLNPPPKRALGVRTSVIYGLVFISFTSLIVRLGYLQIGLGQKFRSEAMTTSLTKIPVLPARGWIYDRHGNLLAYDEPFYSVYLTRLQNQDYKAMAEKLSPVFHMTVNQIVQLMNSQQAYATIRLFKDITPQQLAFIEENHASFPGLDIVVDSQRIYPEGDLAGQVLGYVGPITPQNQSQYLTPNNNHYLPSSSVGETGLEAQYENLLQGTIGYQVVENNISGTPVKKLGYQPAPVSGDNLQLTLDGHLQAEGQQQMMQLIRSSAYSQSITQGAAVVLDVHTGGVLAMISYPYLDPNWYTDGSFLKHANYLQTSGAQVNNVIQGPLYPGSTVKPANTFTGLKYGAITPNTTIYDNNYIMIGATQRHGDAAEGLIGLVKSIAVSDDIFFYHLGLNLGHWIGSTSTQGGGPPAGMGYQHWLNTDFAKGVTKLFKGEWEFGLGQLTGIDLPGEQAGRFYIENYLKGYVEQPFSWQKAEQSLQKTGQYVNYGTPLDLAFGAIGQSQQFTPMELGQYVMTIANGGKKLQPHLLQKVLPPGIDSQLTTSTKPLKVVQPILQKNLNLNSTSLQLVRQGMWGVCNMPYGTAYGSFYNSPYQAAGKTGTAQIYMNGRNEYNSVFIGFAPYNNPQIAVAVMIPGAGYGSQTAVPLARQLMDDYFKEHHEFFPKSQWTNTTIPGNWKSSPAYQVPEHTK